MSDEPKPLEPNDPVEELEKENETPIPGPAVHIPKPERKTDTPLHDWFTGFALAATVAMCCQVAKEENVDPLELFRAAAPDILPELKKLIDELFPAI